MASEHLIHNTHPRIERAIERAGGRQAPMLAVMASYLIDSPCAISWEKKPPKGVSKIFTDIILSKARSKYAREDLIAQLQEYYDSIPEDEPYVDLHDLLVNEFKFSKEEATGWISDATSAGNKGFKLPKDSYITYGSLDIDKKKHLITGEDKQSHIEWIEVAGEVQVQDLQIYQNDKYMRYDVVKRATREIRVERKLLKVSFISTLVPHLAKNKESKSGSTNKTYDITALASYAIQLAKFGDRLSRELTPIVLCYVALGLDGTLVGSNARLDRSNTLLDRSNKELAEERKELRSTRLELRSTNKKLGDTNKKLGETNDILSQTQGEFMTKRSLTDTVKNEMSIMVLWYDILNPETDDMDNNLIKIVIHEGLVRHESRFLNKHKGRSGGVHYQRMNNSKLDICEIFDDLRLRGFKIHNGNCHSLLINKKILEEVLKWFDNRCGKYQSFPPTLKGEAYKPDVKDFRTTLTAIKRRDDEASLLVMEQILILIYKEVSGKRKDKRKTYFIQIPWGKDVNMDEYGTEEDYERFLIHVEKGSWIEDLADVMELTLKEDDDGDKYTFVKICNMDSFHEELEPFIS